MPDHPIVVVGASAGGVEALAELVKRLPRDFAASVFVSMHFPASSVSLLPQILSRLQTLPARHPIDGEAICPGQIYIAPPNHHLVFQSDKIHLNRGPRENGHRPAIDVMFRSAAHAFGDRVIGVILTGMLDDGTAGLLTIKVIGGMAIVQDPDEALFAAMPRSAIDRVSVDWVLKLEDIARLLVQLVQPQPAGDRSKPWLNEKPVREPAQKSTMSEPQPIFNEDEQVARSKASLERGEQSGNASPITCPDCGGVLWELREGSLIRFRCHVGHAYSSDSLVEEQSHDVEKSLWSAVRALEEKAALARRMAAHAREQHRPKSAEQFEERAAEAHHHAGTIRHLIIDSLKRNGSQDDNGDFPDRI